MSRWVPRGLALVVLCVVYLPAGTPVAGSVAAKSACTKIKQAVTVSGKTSMRSLCLLAFPGLITMDKSGNLYVSVGSPESPVPRAGVVKLSQDGVVLGMFGTYGTRPGQFISPTGEAVDHAGNIYVADGALNRVNKFSPRGKFLAKWGDSSGRAGLNSPAGEAFDPHGHLWVADLYDNRVVEYSTSGKYLGSCCKPSPRFPMGFLHPMDLQFDAQGDMYVAEHLAGAVAKFDPRGNFLGITLPTYAVVEGMALDSRGNVYEGATLPPGYIPKFSPSLKHITNIRVGGAGADLVVDRAGDMYLTDDTGNRIVKTDSKGKWLAVWR